MAGIFHFTCPACFNTLKTSKGVVRTKCGMAYHAGKCSGKHNCLEHPETCHYNNIAQDIKKFAMKASGTFSSKQETLENLILNTHREINESAAAKSAAVQQQAEMTNFSAYLQDRLIETQREVEQAKQISQQLPEIIKERDEAVAANIETTARMVSLSKELHRQKFPKSISSQSEQQCVLPLKTEWMKSELTQLDEHLSTIREAVLIVYGGIESIQSNSTSAVDIEKVRETHQNVSTIMYVVGSVKQEMIAATSAAMARLEEVFPLILNRIPDTDLQELDTQFKDLMTSDNRIAFPSSSTPADGVHDSAAPDTTSTPAIGWIFRK